MNDVEKRRSCSLQVTSTLIAKGVRVGLHSLMFGEIGILSFCLLVQQVWEVLNLLSTTCG